VNSINTKQKKGVIPVTIKTTYDFSALDGNWTTVRFGNIAPINGVRWKGENRGSKRASFV
jgi:hypothetical protein